MTARTIRVEAAGVSVDTGRRQIRGRIAPWGQLGYTSAGPTVFATGSIHPPDNPQRVKLLRQHDDEQEAVGYAIAFAFDASGMDAVFYLPPSPAGDDALRAAAAGTRDGLSVGVTCDAFEHDAAGTLHVAAAELVEVSLVTIPAFRDAFVHSVAANRTEPPMTDPQPAPEPEETPQTDPPAPAPAAAPADPDDAPAPADRVEAQARAVVPGRVAARGLSLRAAAAVTLDHLRRGRSASGLSAALADLVPADDAGQGLIRPQFVGELWEASRAERPVIDAISRAVLESLTVIGWKWSQRFLVDPYTGNKTAIPSQKVTTAPVTQTAQRWAGGLDVDRVFIDLGTPGMIESLFAQGTDEYRRKTESYVVTELLADASTITATSLTDFLIQAGVEAAQIGARVSFVTVASDVWASFAGLSSADVPWWLDNGDGSVNVGSPAGTAGKVTFSVNPDLAAGVVLAGDARAATWYEVNPPIRVRAENIPNGGVDIGVFGYGALIVNDSSALWTATIAAEAPAVAAKSTSK